MNGLKQLVAHTTFKKGIVVPSVAFIFLVTILSSFFPQLTGEGLGHIQQWIFTNLNWVYVWSVTLFVIFLLGLVFSKYGSIVLGDDNSVPEYSFFSWISMLFAAGMGIGLMYFSVAEPVSHFSDEAFSELTIVQRTKKLNYIPSFTGEFTPGLFMQRSGYHWLTLRIAINYPFPYAVAFIRL